MNLVHRSRRILREDGVLSLLWRSVRFVWTTTVWRRELVQWLPASAVALAFAVRSRLLPHVSDANPTRPIRVDPDEIEYYHGSDDPWRLGHVIDSDWDDPEGRFEETAVYRSLEARFLEGDDWAETELYAEYRDRLEDGDPYWRCTTEAELEAYFERIDDLYESMAEEGYRSQRALLADDDADPREENTDAVHPVVQEIGVNVYRDGELVKKGAGFHRLAIAKLLDLEEIPVTVRVRHADWQAVRNEIRAASSRAELSERAESHLDHPDLRDVVPERWRQSQPELTADAEHEASGADGSEDDDDVPVPQR
ncbi:hypothetical protein [Natronococcus sp. A-GB7]|uniref:hypothetical protein n=1 Tax=Natronococcus sp. A-GB7 TaxID=3037649 RepID=UPI00241E4536|nr:hypothetical protein [Natronococcus sp. A-GB7]MDG5818737.1 hypothetical protein [Natronococcus sp. A-GB7]